MKILALNWNDLKNPYGGGAEVHLEEILRRLVKRGHEVTLVCSGWEGSAPHEIIEGVRIIRTGQRYTFNFVVPGLLRKLVKQEPFDVLVENINKIPFYTPQFLDIKKVILINHLFSTTVFQEANPILAGYVFLAEYPLKWAYRDEWFNVVSESTRDDLLARGITPQRISIVYSGIDRKQYTPDPSVPKAPYPAILYVGRIKKYKSIQHLILAFKRVLETLPDARLGVVGAGDFLPNLKAIVDTLKLNSQVEFTGFVSQEEKIKRMRQAHVQVLPSPREGWGLTNTEANAVGTAVIAANSPGLRDSISDGVSGFLYEYGNIDHLTEKLLQVLTNNATRTMLERGGLEWSKRFDWDDATRKFEEVLQQRVSQPR